MLCKLCLANFLSFYFGRLRMEIGEGWLESVHQVG